MKCVVDEHDSYIYLSCDKALHNTTDVNPIVPYHVKNKCMIGGANCLKSLQEKPEYVSTCCHRLLFKNTVKIFNIDKYDHTNYIVKKCLSYRYRMKIVKDNGPTQSSQYIQHDWPQINRNTMERYSDYEYMEEYICVTDKAHS